MKDYDIIVIGAGIAGCSSAYFLKEKGLSVLVLDRAGIATVGGSAAAGAFVSPKIGKGSSLQTLTNEAFEFSKTFYLKNFPKYFVQTGVIRIPKDEQNAELFVDYEKHDYSKRTWISEEALLKLGIYKSQKSFLFSEAGVCDASKMCEALLEGIDYLKYDVKSLNYKNKLWHIGSSSAKKIILATGYENKFFDLRYLGVKGTWGTRGDYETSLDLTVSMHKKISISANIEGIIKVGATHEKEVQTCKRCGSKPLEGLLEVASEMVDTSDFKLKKSFCGMRAGSKDYFPLVGSVINVTEMLKENPKLVCGAKLKANPVYINNLYVCNGLGGRGFVFAPLMAKMLADNIVDGKAIDERVNPDRLFLKWCRKSPDLER
ncbi:MAG: FAD dependent oxidoreductase [uncultured Sulfurovum sp.]|uniref:FAD dependent oxidoreductase n=1 Tax=uncultured Sulfurovum sp. TaxID=269237 RepID=A0A6S6SS51_9BACT|nr:MAG: FAD dependent oxidoreductase [uncultured Sulfurovum sp.]